MTARSQQASIQEQMRLPNLGKWITSGLFSFVLIGTVIWLAYKLSDPATMPIHKVQVTGDFVYLQESMLKTALGGQMNEGFFSVDVSHIKDKVEKLAWVDNATVRRQWPDTLTIHVTEQKPLAHWADGGFVNWRGEVFFPVHEYVPAQLPVFKGDAASSHELTATYHMMDKILSAIGRKIGQLELDGRGALQLQLDNEMKIILGREGATERLVRFVELYDRIFANRTGQVIRVDLRYANGMAIRWKKDISEVRG